MSVSCDTLDKQHPIQTRLADLMSRREPSRRTRSDNHPIRDSESNVSLGTEKPIPNLTYVRDLRPFTPDNLSCCRHDSQLGDVNLDDSSSGENAKLSV